MKTIVYEAPITSISGYGEHSREIADYLLKYKEEYSLHIVNTSWGNTHNSIKVCSNQLLTHMKTDLNIDTEIDLFIKVGLLEDMKCVGNKNIGISAGVETTLCSKNAIVKCNLMDLIIVPSSFSKQVIETSSEYHNLKLKTEIMVIQESFDYDLSKVSSSDRKPVDDFLNQVTEDFCFATFGEWDVDSANPNDRKNIETMLRTFYESFDNTDDVAFILKVNNRNYTQDDFDSILNKIKQIKSDYDKTPSVYLLHSNLKKSQLNYLHSHEKIKCCVFATKGEGFGRSILLSTISGKPTLVSNWSGPLDYIKDESFLIEGSLDDSPNKNKVFIEGCKWFKVDKENLSDKMKKIKSNYCDFQEKAKKLSKENRKKHTPNRVCGMYKQVLDSYVLSNR